MPKLNIHAAHFNDDGISLALSNGVDRLTILEVGKSKDLKKAAAKAAILLLNAANRFAILASKAEPFKHITQERINRTHP